MHTLHAHKSPHHTLIHCMYHVRRDRHKQVHIHTVLCKYICVNTHLRIYKYTHIHTANVFFSFSWGVVILHLTGPGLPGNPSGYVCVCVFPCVCLYLAEFSASFSEQMVLQQVIMTQDKLLNWLCLCEGRDTKYHCRRERDRDSQSPSWVSVQIYDVFIWKSRGKMLILKTKHFLKTKHCKLSETMQSEAMESICYARLGPTGWMWLSPRSFFCFHLLIKYDSDNWY